MNKPKFRELPSRLRFKQKLRLNRQDAKSAKKSVKALRLWRLGGSIGFMVCEAAVNDRGSRITSAKDMLYISASIKASFK